MRKLTMFNMMTLDGYFSGPNGEIDWHNSDEEFGEFAPQNLDAADALLFGRVTYDLMAGYWPVADDDPEVARRMNGMPKYVFSRTMKSADWANTTLITSDAVAAVAKLKAQDGKDLLLLGSANFGATLAKEGLIDTYQVMINPVLLGAGVPLLPGSRLVARS